MKLAEERDHRRIGQQQELFFFHKWSPGSAFFLPHGTRIYNKLVNLIKAEYNTRGYEEVITPNVFNIELWKTSGHYENYKENMFTFECEKQEFGMKPMVSEGGVWERSARIILHAHHSLHGASCLLPACIILLRCAYDSPRQNCPGHCLMFDNTNRSYRDLPVRYADFGALHRNEISGALSGLTRVRRFQQDDAHIFCRQDQIEVEVAGVLAFLKRVYGIFGFEFSLQLSTRPKKYLGEIAVWDEAERALGACLDTFCREVGMGWTLNAEDGAFYGPKIDIQLTDALKRKHQCATIQLDFQLPIKFALQYKGNSDAFERPVIIHRAILGSVERFMSVLIEHTGGKWPFWLSPRQVCIVPIAETYFPYAEKVKAKLHAAGYYVDVDASSSQLKKKVRDAALAQYNYILVVGAKEEAEDSVNVRLRSTPDATYELTFDALLAELKMLTDSFK
jgi:threonyl-tRNA synthetase